MSSRSTTVQLATLTPSTPLSTTTRSRSRSPTVPKQHTDLDLTNDLDDPEPAMSSDAPNDDSRAEDYEPLLGSPGDQVQTRTQPLAYNLVTGTAILAQAGILILASTVWAAVFTHPFIYPFSLHPLLNSLGALLGIQAALVLQPTASPAQKRAGALVHGSANGLAFVAYVLALAAIYWNKDAHGGEHFASVHARLGLATYVVLLVQTLVGFSMYFVPAVYGGVDAAKSVWKYHRMSGYLVLTLGLATVCAATKTDYNVNVLGMELWVMIVASVLVLLGLLPRVKLQKFGLKTGASR